MQKMTERPPSMAALVLRAMNYSVDYQFYAQFGEFRSQLIALARYIDRGFPYLIGLLQDDTALAVANDNPVDVGVGKLLNGDLTGEGTVGLVEDVLGGNTDLGVGELAGQSEVQSRRRDDDLGVGVELGGVEVLDDAGDALLHTVPVFVESVLQLRDASRALAGHPEHRGVV